MINKHKKFLTAAVFCAIASTGFVLTASAEETMTHDLDEVVVEADKDALPGSYVKTKGSIGILGEKSILDVPFSNMNITQKTILAAAACSKLPQNRKKISQLKTAPLF